MTPNPLTPTYDFTGQVALVTGASSGMGLAIARTFAESGASVVMADVNREALDAVARDLRHDGSQALAVDCDVADEDQVASLVRDAVREFGRLDMAFNAAGVQAPLVDAADERAEDSVPPSPVTAPHQVDHPA